MNTKTPCWDLNSMFPGESDSIAFSQFLISLKVDMKKLKQWIEENKATLLAAKTSTWSEVLFRLQDLMAKRKEAQSFTMCLLAQNTRDMKAKKHHEDTKRLHAHLLLIMNLIDEIILDIPEPIWRDLLKREELVPIAFPLMEKRVIARKKLAPSREALAHDLAVDGYHGWSDLYSTIVSHISIPWKNRRLSIGQANNLFSHPDREVRLTIFEELQKAWREVADLCCSTLNHLSGFRLSLYQHRGWDILQEPLQRNRLSRKTFETMVETLHSLRPHLITYLNHKAELLGLSQLSWFDLKAPLVKKEGTTIAYEEGCQFIMAQLEDFSPHMATFAARAIKERWIEAQNRSNKHPGGLCTYFPMTGQSRICMTFSGSFSCLSTLAHELGHAYHQNIMEDLPLLLKSYPLCLAETSSTFAEMVVVDAAIKRTRDPTEKIYLLDSKLQRAIIFLMTIHARLLFEHRFYQRRERGLVEVDELEDLMVRAQEEAYAHSLANYDPLHWASKLHFYLTTIPFYNFPYTFGYLFSSFLYQRALEEGPHFAEDYRNLLRDSGSMSVEDLGERYLRIQLNTTSFWERAMEPIVKDIQEFTKLQKTIEPPIMKDRKHEKGCDNS